MAIATDDATAARAAAGGAEKRAYVRQIFSEIAPRYDFLNHFLSLNIDRGWRRKAIAELGVERVLRGRYLDLCAGTMDLSLAIARVAGFDGSVISADFAEAMLRAGARKVEGAPVAPVTADALELPVADESISGAIVGFGIRNVAGLDAALVEVHRVLKRAARFVILEFSTPRSSLINSAYQQYFKPILPKIGGFVSGHPTAYKYLPESVANFPTGDELARRMEDVGYVNVRWQPLTFGMVAIHVGERA
jgi:demethylmenaquinone methyltransferase/2-methoxy-6-polyprenyl-1,4-benzoquinol methylase